MRITQLQLAFVAVLFTVAPPAVGAGPGDQAAGAALFEEAKRLAGAGDYEHACPKFVEAQRLAPTAGTLLNIGNCYEKLGKLASAWGAFKEAEVMARNLNDADREQEANRRAQALTPQLAKLAINVPPGARVPGFELRRDGTAIGDGQWGSALPVDTGQHTIEASAPGRKRWSTWVRIDTNGSSATIEVPVLEVVPADTSAGPQRVASWGPQRIAGAALGGAGLVPLVVGAIFAAKAAGKNSESLPYCRPNDITKCDATGVALRNEAFDAARVSSITFIVGSVAAAAGIVVVLTAPSAAPRKTVGTALRVRAQPLVGPSIAGVALHGAW